MACELPASYVAARTWDPNRNPKVAANARLWAPIPEGTGCDALPSEDNIRSFNGLAIYTFSGERITLFT